MRIVTITYQPRPDGTTVRPHVVQLDELGNEIPPEGRGDGLPVAFTLAPEIPAELFVGPGMLLAQDVYRGIVPAELVPGRYVIFAGPGGLIPYHHKIASITIEEKS